MKLREGKLYVGIRRRVLVAPMVIKPARCKSLPAPLSGLWRNLHYALRQNLKVVTGFPLRSNSLSLSLSLSLVSPAQVLQKLGTGLSKSRTSNIAVTARSASARRGSLDENHWIASLTLAMTTVLALLTYLCLSPSVPDTALAAPANPLKTTSAPSLSLSSSEPTINISTSPSSSTVTDSLVITTITDNPTGHTTTISTSTNDTCLKPASAPDCASATSKFSPVSGTTTSPSTLNANQWGVTLASSFTNTDKGDDSVWFAIPADIYSAPVSTSSAPTPTTGQTQTITFGAKANFQLPAGAYTNTVVITATTNTYNPPPPTITSITPNSGLPDGGETIVITGTNLDTAYQVFIDLDNDGDQDNGEECTNANIDSNTQISCTTPTSNAGTYRVIIKTWGGVTPDTAADDYIYQAPIITQTPFTVADGSSGIVEIDRNMIPIKYTGDNTTPQWQKADITNAANDWYDYDNQQWANAVTVTPASLATYQSAAIGTPIAEADILGYFTYVPRYAYQVDRYSAKNTAVCGTSTNVTTTACFAARQFNIAFQKSTDTKCVPTSYNGTGDYTAQGFNGGCNSSGTSSRWATHPAFTFGTTQLNGLWIGKFETSAGTTTNPNTDANARTVVKNGSIFIKPNQYSLLTLNSASMFKLSRLMGQVTNADRNALNAEYLDGNATDSNLVINNQVVSGVPTTITSGNYMNFASTTANLDAHSMKNSEWGAVAYLASSSYGTGVAVGDEPGLNGGATEGGVRINANESYVTGCGPSDSNGSTSSYTGGLTCTSGGVNKSYYTTLGVLASTTKNVYGIYDLSGGAVEYVMAVYGATTTSPNSGYYCDNGDRYGVISGGNKSVFSGFNGVCYYAGAVATNDANATSPATLGINFPNAKYYNLYSGTIFSDDNSYTNYNYCTWATCGGHALYESKALQSTTSTSGQTWGGEGAAFVRANNSWNCRGAGANSGTAAGLWAVCTGNGSPANNGAWRQVVGIY